MKDTLEKINNIPVRTWRWLGVNNVSIDEKIPKIKPYNLNKIESIDKKDIKVFPMNKFLNAFKNIDTLDYNGISDELLNQAKNSFNTGAYIETHPDKTIDEPVFINYYMDKDNPTVVDNNLIIAESGSTVTVVIRYDSENDSKCYHNGITRLYAKAGSTINLIKIQTLSENSMHFDSTVGKLEDDAVINYTEVDLGALYSITNYRNDLAGFRSSSNAYTIYLGDKKRTIDINYLINHFGKQTKTSIKASGALLDESKKTFRGTIDFKKGCAKAKGAEDENVMVLSPSAVNKSVPVLLCTEEDVDGQHAASSGRVDKNKLFYLMTRGFSEKEAEKFIIEAAFNPIIDKIPLKDVREEILNSVRRKLSND